MRRFHSYGPVNCKYHFCVLRTELIDRCVERITGNAEDTGHYFTIWAPRQAGKTWLMRQVKSRIERSCGDRFQVAAMSMQGLIFEENEEENAFLSKVSLLFQETFRKDVNPPDTWENLKFLFSEKRGIFDRPLILFIDEFDSLPPRVIDRLVTLFRDMYLKKETYQLHGLALIGVRAVLGMESLRGSPFNVQRALHVPNLSEGEVTDLFRQYIQESGQAIEPEVVSSAYRSTRGQPGLVSWFGELLTETYNPGKEQPIDLSLWNYVYGRARRTEWNNTLLNLIAKAKGRHTDKVIDLFSRSDIPFSLRNEWCGYLYLNGIIDAEDVIDENGQTLQVCRFSSPFVQHNLYDALTDDLVGDRLPILALDPLDELNDVFAGDHLDLPALLNRYRDYLKRLAQKGLNPWKDQPRRADIHLTEAVGHFHLYAWLMEAVGQRCTVSPEFPTGNGKVDLHLRCGEKRGVIEVKSFTNAAAIKSARVQAARYATSLGMDRVTVALFMPVNDESVLKKLSGETGIEGVCVWVAAIGWA